MGFNTVALILNDGLHAIEQDAELGQKIGRAVREVGYRGHEGEVGVSGHYGSMTVLTPQHADTYQVILAGGNTIKRLSVAFSSDPEAILRGMADQMGYTLRKKPSAAATP